MSILTVFKQAKNPSVYKTAEALKTGCFKYFKQLGELKTVLQESKDIVDFSARTGIVQAKGLKAEQLTFFKKIKLTWQHLFNKARRVGHEGKTFIKNNDSHRDLKNLLEEITKKRGAMALLPHEVKQIKAVFANPKLEQQAIEVLLSKPHDLSRFNPKVRTVVEAIQSGKVKGQPSEKVFKKAQVLVEQLASTEKIKLANQNTDLGYFLQESTHRMGSFIKQQASQPKHKELFNPHHQQLTNTIKGFKKEELSAEQAYRKLYKEISDIFKEGALKPYNSITNDLKLFLDNPSLDLPTLKSVSDIQKNFNQRLSNMIEQTLSKRVNYKHLANGSYFKKFETGYNKGIVDQDSLIQGVLHDFQTGFNIVQSAKYSKHVSRFGELERYSQTLQELSKGQENPKNLIKQFVQLKHQV